MLQPHRNIERLIGEMRRMKVEEVKEELMVDLRRVSLEEQKEGGDARNQMDALREVSKCSSLDEIRKVLIRRKLSDSDEEVDSWLLRLILKRGEEKEEEEKVKPTEVWYNVEGIELYVNKDVYKQMKELLKMEEREVGPNSSCLCKEVKLKVYMNEYTEEGIWEGPSAVVRKKERKEERKNEEKKEVGKDKVREAEEGEMAKKDVTTEAAKILFESREELERRKEREAWVKR